MNQREHKRTHRMAPAAIALCALLAGCQAGTGDTQEPTSASHDEETVITTIQASEGIVNDELVLNGAIACDEGKVSKLYIPCSGKVQGVEVEIGDRVERGQLLGTVFSQEAAEHEKQLSDIANEIRIAERELAMRKELHEAGLASDRELMEAQSEADRAHAERKRLQSVAGVQGFAAQAQATLTAPIAGYVVAKSVYNGSYIDDTNNDTPAFEIANLGSVWVTADVYESDIRKIRPGERVRVSVLAYPGEPIEGRIDKIYKTLDEESKTMKVKVRIANAEERFLPGMFASVHVTLEESGRRMIKVPAESVIFENGNNYVVVRDSEGKYHRQPVRVAHQDERHAYIASGLKAGDTLVERNAILQYNALK